jgi:hypothetical protein
MSFANPPYPWVVFSGVLLCVSLVNYMIVSLANYMISSRKSLGMACMDFWELCKKGWMILRVGSGDMWEAVARW